MTRLDCETLQALLQSKSEIALIDVREEGEYSKAHLLFAVCISLSYLDIRAARLLPRKSVRIVLCDGGDANNQLARRAARQLTELAYENVEILAGGPSDWDLAGLEIYSGVNVPSKAMGEFIEHWYDTPRLPASELQAMKDRGDDLVILDSRPMAEYERMNIPGGIDCPGAELVYRINEMAPNPKTTVIVNCAGRTRSIIGAQSLINAGIPNPVYALKDGTMGWQLGGFDVETGRTSHAPSPGPESLRLAEQRAEQVARRFGVIRADASQLAQWQNDVSRTTMLLDVRTEQEYIAGHWPGAQHAPGGQLVQATDEYVATRGARIVLADSADGVRATMTAHWLIQLGWTDVCILCAAPPQAETGRTRAPDFDREDTISATQLQQLLATDSPPAMIDLASSLKFRSAHIPGAFWAVRSRIIDCLSDLPECQHIVLMASNDMLAHLTAADLRQHGVDKQVSVLDGGLRSWKAISTDVESGLERALIDVDDVWFKPYDYTEDPQQAMRDYLTWEVGLIEQIEREGLARFKQFA